MSFSHLRILSEATANNKKLENDSDLKSSSKKESYMSKHKLILCRSACKKLGNILLFLLVNH